MRLLTFGTCEICLIPLKPPNIYVKKNPLVLLQAATTAVFKQHDRGTGASLGILASKIDVVVS